MLTHETIITKSGAKKHILAFSDLQYDQFFSPRIFEAMSDEFLNIIRREAIDYVFILGDVINSLNILNQPDAYRRLLAFLRIIAEQAPILMVLGNHDAYYYDDKNHLHIAPPYPYDQYIRDLESIPHFHLLRASSRKTAQIFDDGAIRVLGLDLPDPCYYKDNSERKFQQNGQTAFDNLVKDCLPELTKVPNRDYYLLTHSPAYLKPGLIPKDVMVLAGHFHHGLVPPILDEITRFTNRGIMGPGLTRCNRYTTQYEPFPRNARLRPTPERPWVTLRPIKYLGDRWLNFLNIFYPKISFAIIRDGDSKSILHVKEKYHFKRRLP